jgi:lincosamide nucleotidyltransferase A/C/D/E
MRVPTVRPLSIAGVAYRRLARSRWAFMVEATVVQRVRRRLKATGPREVHRLLEALAAAGVRAHVSGGWGVDALLGRQTRAHTDLDIVVHADAEGVDAVLNRLGYRVVPDLDRRLEHPLMGDRTMLRDGRGHEVDVHRVAPEDWQKLEARQAFVAGAIGGRAVSCISCEMQEETHRGYGLSAKHHRDLAQLRRRFGADATRRGSR